MNKHQFHVSDVIAQNTLHLNVNCNLFDLGHPRFHDLGLPDFNWLLYKRLEKQRFVWPDWFTDEILELKVGQLDQLLDGYNLNGMRPHRSVSFAHAF